MSEIRSIFILTREQIVLHARQQAEAGERCVHGYENGSAQAWTWEHAYAERRREIDALSAEVV